jgi:feruloyl esterase
MRQCDTHDGVEDGVVSRPDLCQPELQGLQCEADTGDDCFSQPELAAIERLYQGATVDGVQLYPGITPGSESLWPTWVTGSDDDAAWGERAAEGNLRLTYGIPSTEPFNPHDYVLADELENLQRLAPILNATSPDLSALAEAGGKLFYYHGLADPLILPGRAQQYYEEAVELQGKEKLDEFARFVMVPGHGHCWEKPGQVADDFNPLVVIDQWVESGQAPDFIIAVQKDAGGATIRSRKLCPLPQLAQLQGGDQTQAESYECVNP